MPNYPNTNPHRPLNRFVAMLLFTAALLSILVISNFRAYASAQPYGGCKEAWQAPHSQGAKDCRRHGWVVRSRIVVNPHGVVMASRLPHCRAEDGSGQRSACSWNLGGRMDGLNREGLAYWVDRQDRAHYVWTTAPSNGWQWVSRTVADVFAEGGSRDADTRKWERCQVKYAMDKADMEFYAVKCADGFRYRSRP